MQLAHSRCVLRPFVATRRSWRECDICRPRPCRTVAATKQNVPSGRAIWPRSLLQMKNRIRCAWSHEGIQTLHATRGKFKKRAISRAPGDFRRGRCQKPWPPRPHECRTRTTQRHLMYSYRVAPRVRAGSARSCFLRSDRRSPSPHRAMHGRGDDRRAGAACSPSARRALSSDSRTAV